MLQGNIDKLFIVFFTINKVKKKCRVFQTIFRSPIIIRFYLQFLTTSFDFLFCLSILILLNSRIFFSFLIKSICCINTLIRVFILLNLFLFGHIFSPYFWWVKTSKNNLNYWRPYFFFQSETSFNCPMKRLLSSSHRKFAFRSYNRVQSNVQCEK